MEASVSILQKELDEKVGLLAAERDRTSRLETDAQDTNQRHEELKSLITEMRRSLLDKVTDRNEGKVAAGPTKMDVDVGAL